jgi:hypothetical protein
VNVFITVNYTLLLRSIEEDQNVTGKWTTGEIATFKGYRNRIYTISKNGTITPASKFNQIKTVLTGFAGPTTPLYIKVHKILIDTWGTIKQYCACPNK